ncbi:response regulator transcription factor [Pediococcus stilesii]|uniref:Response regulator transcription factor n=1 Tax=Pediococcus stilesii TaxID=331679 RepID=A0A5R9BX63_9LACO|nr:response regulator transcription factor [Pediococcus stilesii]TLQ05308.1 response regulator transcription factor [Pediococcus stilesii]
MRILMIEDNKSVSDMMGMFFKKEKWNVTFAYDGLKAVEIFKTDPGQWDIVLLDLNLPGKDGMEVAAELRRMSQSIPLIMLTARDSESDQVLGLEMGADEYITKPFSPITLIARIKALHRRVAMNKEEAEKGGQDEKFDVRTTHLKISTTTREVYLDNNLISDLTPKEFDLLKTLAQKPMQVFSREQLLQMVWDYEYYVDERTVDAHIKKLRQKLEAVGPQVVQTVWGVGYKFDDSKIDED